MTESTPASDVPLYLSGDKAGLREFLDKFDVFLFDCDGVLWSGDHCFPGTVETLELLRNNGKQVVFVTNNSTKSRADYCKKLEGLGIPSTVEEVFSSSYSSSIYISRILQLPANKRKVYVIGETGIEQELRSENVPFIGGTDPAYRRDVKPEDYKLIAAGDESILRPRSRRRPRRSGFPPQLPQAGPCVPLRQAWRREPTALGKPAQAMMDAIEGKFKFDRSRACMVGDRANTDIRFGREGKLGGTLGVLTGVSSKEDFESGPVRPHAYLDKLSDLLGSGL
ncbi:4-nitrophenylphosphatase [Penicillium manginii]|uniref:4-nitrophenylphosphatase n=1 Tax=Penicillium manginii TaxID=203109 RepID=UPI0025485237|nr:4-nitrophenylphosphatase [Penicillium manginii]KAJ5768532.1 4-nitrophenylphosphatase [Penicillium manginii]